ncbi:MAG: hypothetical protein KJZ65_15260, partial [Phycisphaerales bacterium]|nr:hypothetical protein [Phycisphaerales bacterium]
MVLAGLPLSGIGNVWLVGQLRGTPSALLHRLPPAGGKESPVLLMRARELHARWAVARSRGVSSV